MEKDWKHTTTLNPLLAHLQFSMCREAQKMEVAKVFLDLYRSCSVLRLLVYPKADSWGGKTRISRWIAYLRVSFITLCHLEGGKWRQSLVFA